MTDTTAGVWLVLGAGLTVGALALGLIALDVVTRRRQRRAADVRRRARGRHAERLTAEHEAARQAFEGGNVVVRRFGS